MNVRILNITNDTFVVLWNTVINVFPVNYTIKWYRVDGYIGMVTVNSPPYNAIGLTANTCYSVTVVAINTCCGAGPFSDVTMVMTNDESSRPPSSYGPTTPPAAGNVIYISSIYVCILCE